ncbi:MAG: DUF3365 domain-containing protein [Betaproteobacteria bacterium]|nr:DUF3365 domain-containing protein [Betaproteobacteria bacterium]
MKKQLLASASLLLAISAPAFADDMAQYQEESRKVVKEFAAQLGGEMQKEMKENGPVAAIKVCRNVAPAIASEVSRKNGWNVGRKSLKTRNAALGMPDAWEQKVLADFEKRMEKENPAGMEFAEIVAEPQGKFFRYMKAIPVQDLCLKCHGSDDTLAPNVKDALKTEYPHDKATGYTLGQIRGGFTIKRPL